MADTKISALLSGSALDGTEILPMVQGGSTKQTTAQQIADLTGPGTPGQAWQLVDQNGAPRVATAVTITIASPGVVTWNAHGFSAGMPVAFSTTGALPTGLSVGTTYYVVSPTTNTFQVSATSGGAAINTSGSQSGTHSALAGATWAWSTNVTNVTVTGLGKYNKLLVVGRGITTASSGVRRICASVDGGSTYDSTSGDYVAVTTDGIESVGTGWAHSTASTLARTVSVLILNTKGVWKAGIQAATSTYTFFVGSPSDINAIRLDNSGGGNLTAGTLLVFAM